MIRPLFAAALLATLALPASAQDIGSDCPVYAVQTHGEIIHAVEGRLDGDWSLAIKTTERSAKRLRDKGEDASEAEYFVVVLTCLRDEVRAGRHANEVEQAKADPTPERGTAGGKAAAGGGAAGGSTGSSVAAQPLPAPTPTATPQPQPQPQPQTQAAAPAPLPAPVPLPAPLPAPDTTTVGKLGSGTVLPGTAESFVLNSGGAAATPLPGTMPQVAAVPPPLTYAGQACNFFLKPSGRYSEGEWVCHAGAMYACLDGAWEDRGACALYSGWETRLSTTLEAAPR